MLAIRFHRQDPSADAVVDYFVAGLKLTQFVVAAVEGPKVFRGGEVDDDEPPVAETDEHRIALGKPAVGFAIGSHRRGRVTGLVSVVGFDHAATIGAADDTFGPSVWGPQPC